jgi:hypothetical protein
MISWMLHTFKFSSDIMKLPISHLFIPIHIRVEGHLFILILYFCGALYLNKLSLPLPVSLHTVLEFLIYATVNWIITFQAYPTLEGLL